MGLTLRSCMSGSEIQFSVDVLKDGLFISAKPAKDNGPPPLREIHIKQTEKGFHVISWLNGKGHCMTLPANESRLFEDIKSVLAEGSPS